MTAAKHGPDAITDLSQVRWTTRQPHPDIYVGESLYDWHVIGEVGDDPDAHVREVYDLHIEYAHDGDGGDCSAWLADMVARKLSESDTTARWQRDRAVEEVNRTRTETKNRDTELRWDLGNALGWELGDNMVFDDHTPSWADIKQGIADLRNRASYLRADDLAAWYEDRKDTE